MSSAKREFHEKRGFIRMRIDTPAHIEVINQDCITQGICRDLSGGGMLVELDTALPTGTALSVRIASAHGHAPMLTAHTVVSRVEAQPGSTSSSCLLGLEIIELVDA